VRADAAPVASAGESVPPAPAQTNAQAAGRPEFRAQSSRPDVAGEMRVRARTQV